MLNVVSVSVHFAEITIFTKHCLKRHRIFNHRNTRAFTKLDKSRIAHLNARCSGWSTPRPACSEQDEKSSLFAKWIPALITKFWQRSEIIIIIIIIFLHELGLLNCSGIDALPSFPGASTISSSSRFVVEGVFRESGVVRSFKMVDPVLLEITENLELKKNGTWMGQIVACSTDSGICNFLIQAKGGKRYYSKNWKGQERDTNSQCYRDNIWQVPASTCISGIPEAKHRA